MAEELDRASPDRQAIWIALKTLRQRPTVVGRTDEGATIYEIRSVELVLPPGAAHFKRLVPCAKCGRRVPGSFVLGPGDLDHPPNAVFCDRCGRAVDRPRQDAPRERGAPPAAKAQVAEVLSRAPSPVGGAVELQRLSEHVAEMSRGHNAGLGKMSASVGEVRAQMRELGESNRERDDAQRELHQRIDELSARVAALPVAIPDAVGARDVADLRAGVTAMIDATAQTLHTALREGLDHLGAEIASLQQRVDDESAARSEIGQVAEANRELTKGQSDLDQKVHELAAHPHAEIEEKLARQVVEVGMTLAAGLTQGLDHLRSEIASLQQRVDEAVGGRELAEVRATVVDTIGAEEAQLRVEVAERLGLLRAEIALHEQRSQGEFAAVSEQLEAQRKELTEALHDVAQERLMSVVEPLRDLTKAREDFERRLDSTAQQLARLVEAQSQAPPPAPVSRRVPGGIMQSLERQLQAAELRLQQSTSDVGKEE